MITALLLVLAAPPPPQQRPDSASRPPAIVERARIDPRLPVNFRVLVVPETVYVGQQTTYQLAAFVDFSVRDRLRRMEVPEPDMRGVMAYDAPASAQTYPTRAVGSHRYEVHVSERPIFPLAAGRIAIAPAQLVYALPLSYSFFSREETYELRSDTAVIVALAPPAAGRPADWAGAVGSLRIGARLDTGVVRVGAPITLTVRVTGRGNVKLFPRPRLSLAWGQVVPAGERVMLSADSLDIHGAKEFDWLVTPTRSGSFALPAVRYPYFDPAARRYEVAESAPLQVRVLPGTLVADSGAPARPHWALRTTYRGPLPAPPWTSRWFWIVMLLAPVPAAVLGVRRVAHRRRPRTLPAPRQSLGALARTGAGTGDVRAVRRAFLDAIAGRVHATATPLAEPRALARAIRRSGATRATADAAAALLEELNAAAFGHDAIPLPDAARRAEQVYRAIDAEARRARPSVRAGAILALLAGLAGAPVLRAALPPDADHVLFARGVTEYGQGSFAVAEHDFLAVAARAPRAPDAWANAGTAAFAAADTAQAVVGWQRALRLEPRAGDLRDRLTWVGADPGSGPGMVPAVPVAPFALAAALLWLAGWLALLRMALRGTAHGRLLATGVLLGAAIATGAGAAALDSVLAARTLGVTSTDTPLHALPDLGAEPRATLRTGEIVRVLQRDGVWLRVAADGGRVGWMGSASLISLARD